MRQFFLTRTKRIFQFQNRRSCRWLILTRFSIYIMKTQRTSFLKKCKSDRTKVLIKSFTNRESVNFFKFFHSSWTSISCWRQYLIHLFWTVCNLLLIFFRDLHAKLIRSLYKYSSRSSKIVSNSITRMVSCEAFFVTKHVRCSTCHNITFTV